MGCQALMSGFHSDRQDTKESWTCGLANPPTPQSTSLLPFKSKLIFYKAELYGQPTGRKKDVRVKIKIKKSRRGDKREKDQVWIKEIILSVQLKPSDSKRQRIWEREGLEDNKMTSKIKNKISMLEWAHYKTDGNLNDSKWTHNTSAVAAAWNQI